LGRRALFEFAGIVTPDTIRRWYRRLVAKKYDGSTRRGARGGWATRTSWRCGAVPGACWGDAAILLAGGGV